MKIALAATCAVCLAIGACGTSERTATGSNGAGAAAPVAAGPVHAIELPRYQLANLPDAPGREVFAANCLSCHSSRYVTMQPASFDQAVWEAEVKKMVKPYGAPIAAEHVTPIAQYIVAARRANPGAWEAPAVGGATNKMAGAELISGGDVPRGQSLYVQHCASCHAQDGRGDTVAAKSMLPRPTDLTAVRFAPAAIAAAITGGVRGTAMPAYPTLSAADVRDLVAHTGTFGKESRAPEPTAAATSAVVGPAEAAKLFATNCASCHGNAGRGDGFASPPLARAPADFNHRQPTRARALDVITHGIPGTAMPAWEAKLNEPQRAGLAEYVRSLYDDGRR